MTKEDRKEVVVIVKDEIDKSICRYHTERIEKMETNIINEIRSHSLKTDTRIDSLTKFANENTKDIANIKGQLVWITAILVTLLGAILAGLVKYFLN